MSCDSNHNVAGGSEALEGEPHTAQDMESGSSSSSPPVDEGSSSHSTSSPTSPQERRAHIKCVQPRHRRLLTSNVACQTDYTDEWSQMTKDAGTDAASSSSEGTLRLMIQNFKSMTDTVRGPSKEIQGVSWRIMVMPRQHVVQKKGTQKCLGFFLQCCPEAYSDAWSCQAQAELRLISQKNNVPHFTRKTNHNYTAKENDWGYSCFMTWADILDENQGYIKDDRVILEVTVKAETPKNILSHEDFKKSIHNWRELAKLQYSRNCIDLAIEANMQALKFCKDRDQDIRLELEEQKNFFIEQKVKESIQRIEKGKDTTQKPDDEGTSQTALRQALTASNTKHNHTKKDKGRKTKKQRPREPSPPSPAVSPQPAEVRVEEKPKTEKAATITTLKGIQHREPFNLDGHFSKHMQEFFYGFAHDPVSWARRPRDEDEIYNTIARHLTDQLQQMNITEKEAFQYISPLNFADNDGNNIIMEHQHAFLQQMIDQNHDFHLKRKSKAEKKRKGAEEAISFREFIERQFRDHPQTKDEVDEEVQKMSVDLAPIFTEESRTYREGIIDRQPEEAFNPPYMLWSEDDPYYWQEEDFYSERGSTVSSDSDRQYDGCIKAKRSKRDTGHPYHEPCRCVEKIPVPVCEMGVQTDVVPQKQKTCETEKMQSPVVTKTNTNNTTVTPPAPAGRILKKPTSKKNKGRMAETIAAVAANPPPATVSAPTIPPPPVPVIDHATAMLSTQPFPIVEGENIIASPLDKMDDMKAHSVIPRILPMEYAMKFFPNAIPNGDEQPQDGASDPNKVMEDWVRSWLIEAQKIKPTEGNSMIANPQDFLSQYSEQVVTALSAVAMNFMNVRRVVQKMNEIVVVLNERTTVLKLSKVHADIFRLAGHEPQPVNDAKFCPPAREVEGDYVLVEQLNYMDEIKAKIEEQITLDKETAKKVTQALKQLEERLAASLRTGKDFEKKYEETDKAFKKYEKTTKAEINTHKNNWATERDRAANLARDLKEKNKEVKRLENKYATTTTEKDEYFEKTKVLQKEMSAVQKKHTDEVTKLRREMSSLNESRKHLQAGIGERDNEIKSLNHQVEERMNTIKKQKAEIDQEKQKVAALNQQVLQSLERAKKAETDLLNKELESGVALLERAHKDATKQRREMEEAASNRARNQSEMNNYINSRNDWNVIVEQIESFIKKAKADYAAHIEQINSGKPLAGLPRISVPKPPMPPTIIKVPPIVSVEPTKPTPGVIGSRPTGHMGPTISPQSRAPGSPIQKPAQVSPGSPVRHPGAIGTRPNGAPVNGASAERTSHDMTAASSTGSSNGQSNGGSILNSWAWPDISDVVNPSSSNDLLSMQPSRVDQNGWDEQNNTWSNNHNNQFSSPLGLSRSAFREPPGWPRPQSAQQQLTMEQQRMMYINSPWPHIVDRVSKKLHVDHEAAFGMANQYIREHNLSVMRVNPDDVADAVFQKRFQENQRLPPGAAPGYLQNPLMGSFMDRTPIAPPLGSMLNQEHMLNNLLGNDNIRPTPTADKWSTGL